MWDGERGGRTEMNIDTLVSEVAEIVTEYALPEHFEHEPKVARAIRKGIHDSVPIEMIQHGVKIAPGQWGHAGEHRHGGTGLDAAHGFGAINPRGLHHHHDEKCQVHYVIDYPGTDGEKR